MFFNRDRSEIVFFHCASERLTCKKVQGDNFDGCVPLQTPYQAITLDEMLDWILDYADVMPSLCLKINEFVGERAYENSK